MGAGGEYWAYDGKAATAKAMAGWAWEALCMEWGCGAVGKGRRVEGAA